MNVAHKVKKEVLNPDTGLSRVEYWCGEVQENVSIRGSEQADIAHTVCDACIEAEAKNNEGR